MSTIEADLTALTLTVREVIELKPLMHQLGVEIKGDAVVYCDNDGSEYCERSYEGAEHEALVYGYPPALAPRADQRASKAAAPGRHQAQNPVGRHDEMLADGMAKLLPCEEHKAFVEQLGIKAKHQVDNGTKLD
jgi:hypothetical protein